MTKIKCGIMGARHHPPARALLDALPINTPLILRADPTNAVDPNAIGIWLQTADIPERSFVALDGSLKWYSTNVAAVLATPSYHVGYVPAPIAAKLRGDKLFPLYGDVVGRFDIGSQGGPRVEFDLPPSA